MGLPFLPVRGVKGSDLRRLHPEYSEVTCPFTGEVLVAVPALRPDVALLHAPFGDRYGNLHLDQPYVLDERFAGASATVVATVDRLVSTDEVVAAGVTIPAHLIASLAVVPYGAHPTSCYPNYAYDREHLAELSGGRPVRRRRPGEVPAAVCVRRRRAGVPGADRTAPAGRSGRVRRIHAGLAGALPMTYTLDEWFVVLLARTIRPGETVFHGFGSPCAQVAMHVARRVHARDINLIEGAMYAVNPDPPFIPPTSNDASLARGAAYSMRFEEFFDAAIRGDVDRMFLSGGQIDRYGNTNVTAVGSIERPKVKLGGGGGGCNLAATIGHLTLWSTRHRSGRALVANCDFITDMGHRTPAGSRAELGFTGGGPQTLVTELGASSTSTARRPRPRLTHIYPDVTVDDVRAATGFDLVVAGDLRRPAPPSAAELAALRSLDSLGVRRSEFSARELARTFDPQGRAAYGDPSCAC